MKIVVYQICLRIIRFVILVIRPDYQKFCLKIDPWEVSALSLSSCLCNGGTPNGAVRVAKDNISPSRPDRKMSDKSDIIFSADYLSFGVR